MNGEKLEGFTISHSQITDGGELILTMGEREQNEGWRPCFSRSNSCRLKGKPAEAKSPKPEAKRPKQNARGKRDQNKLNLKS